MITGVIRPMRTTNRQGVSSRRPRSRQRKKGPELLTVVEPVRRGRQRDALAPRREREDLAGEDPADGAVAHAVRSGEGVDAADGVKSSMAGML